MVLPESPTVRLEETVNSLTEAVARIAKTRSYDEWWGPAERVRAEAARVSSEVGEMAWLLAARPESQTGRAPFVEVRRLCRQAAKVMKVEPDDQALLGSAPAVFGGVMDATGTVADTLCLVRGWVERAAPGDVDCGVMCLRLATVLETLGRMMADSVERGERMIVRYSKLEQGRALLLQAKQGLMTLGDLPWARMATPEAAVVAAPVEASGAREPGVETESAGVAAGIDAGDVVLEEYKTLKAEQRERLKSRDRLVYWALAAIAGVVLGMARSDHLATLLLVPPALFLFGLFYLRHDRKVRELRRYIGEDLVGKALALNPALVDPFGWEHEHKEAPRGRVAQKVIQVSAEVGLFCGASLGAIAVFVAEPGWRSPVLEVVWVVEIVLPLVLGCLFVWNAGRRRSQGTGS